MKNKYLTKCLCMTIISAMVLSGPAAVFAASDGGAFESGEQIDDSYGEVVPTAVPEPTQAPTVEPTQAPKPTHSPTATPTQTPSSPSATPTQTPGATPTPGTTDTPEITSTPVPSEAPVSEAVRDIIDRIDALSLLEDIEPKIDDIVYSMNQVNLPMGLNSMISDYSTQIASMTGSYDNLKEFLPLFKAFIGDGSDRTYLLAAQNSSEIRASGGFPGSVGTIRIRDGILSIGDFSSVYNVLSTHTPSAAGITDEEKELFGSWMNAPRDACFDPAFERVAYI